MQDAVCVFFRFVCDRVFYFCWGPFPEPLVFSRILLIPGSRQIAASQGHGIRKACDAFYWIIRMGNLQRCYENCLKGTRCHESVFPYLKTSKEHSD